MSTGQVGVTGRVVGLGEVTATLGAIAPDRIARVRRTVKAEGIGLVSYIRRQKLSGQVLDVQTGRLRSSINDQYVETGTEASTQVGTGVPYARPYELGFSGFVTVREHIRRTKGGTKFKYEKGADGKRKRTQVSQGIAFVREHQRFMYIVARPFLSTSLNERRAAILAKLNAAVHGKG